MTTGTPLWRRLQAGAQARWALLDKPVAAAVMAGLALLLLPTLWRLMRWVWPSDEQGHGPIILAVSLGLVLRRWPLLAAGNTPSNLSQVLGWSVFLLALPAYALGRSQAILMLEVGSLILLAVALLLVFHGAGALRVMAFPLGFLLFTIPLPEALVATITAPLKSAVSLVATSALQALGWPVGRSGVMITAGPYQLLVADACAGLNTLFTLEALGLLYLHLAGHAHWLRNTLLALLLMPIAFTANVLRVMTLVLVTLLFGDAVGQGYAHGLAGLVLFLVALGLMAMTDGVLGLLLRPMLKLRSAAQALAA